MWTYQNLRLHIRYLLIEFLGLVEEPDETEKNWLMDMMKDENIIDKVLLSIEGNEYWYHFIIESHLIQFMQMPIQFARKVLIILIKGWEFDSEKNFSLIKNYWLPFIDKDNLTWSLFQYLRDWNEERVDAIIKILKRSEIDDYQVNYTALIISKYLPELAPKINKILYEKKLDKAIQQLDEKEKIDRYNNHFSIRQLIENDLFSHELNKIAEAAPLSFLNVFFPFINNILGLICFPKDNALTYKKDQIISYSLKPNKYYHHSNLINSIESSIKKIAKENQKDFIKVFNKWKESEYLSIQRLLARGLIEGIDKNHKMCLEFILHDQRRLLLGEMGSEQYESKLLIKELVKYLSSKNIRKLEDYIIKWTPFSDSSKSKDRELKKYILKRNRIARLNLLNLLPKKLLSRSTIKTILVDHRLFKEEIKDDFDQIEAGFIGSPMSKDQMNKAKDKDILSLFHELQDSTDSHHPRDFMKGGSEQASRVLADLAKEYPDRVINIIKKMSPKIHERPVGQAIHSIAETSYPAELLFKLIEEFEEAGFKSETYRYYVAYALEKVAKRNVNLPSNICGILEKWLDNSSLYYKEDIDNDKEDVDNDENIAKDHSNENLRNQGDNKSVLWQPYGITIALPGGTYPILSALTYGYLFSGNPDYEKWYKLLKLHLGRPDKIDTWIALAMFLKYLNNYNIKKSAQLFEELFDKYPGVLYSVNGSMLIAQTYYWLPSTILENILIKLRDSKWNKGAQVYGELIFLIILYRKKDKCTLKIKKDLNELLNLPYQDEVKIRNIFIGVAFSVANLWHNVKYRKTTTVYLIKLLVLQNKEISKALMSVFYRNDNFHHDKYTESFLKILCEEPNLIELIEHHFLFKKLNNLISSYPEYIMKICNNFIKYYDQINEEKLTYYVHYAKDLLDIS
jgi:hypothetical protein